MIASRPSDQQRRAFARDGYVVGLAGALVGRPLDRPPEAQITLRFPVAPGTQAKGPWPHIDGVPSPHNAAGRRAAV